MGRILEHKGGILFEMRDESVYVEPYGADCVRVRATRNAKFSDEKWTLLDAEACDSRVCVENAEMAHRTSGEPELF